jgi:hypothetical protein
MLQTSNPVRSCLIHAGFLHATTRQQRPPLLPCNALGFCCYRVYGYERSSSNSPKAAARSWEQRPSPRLVHRAAVEGQRALVPGLDADYDARHDKGSYLVVMAVRLGSLISWVSSGSMGCLGSHMHGPHCSDCNVLLLAQDPLLQSLVSLSLDIVLHPHSYSRIGNARKPFEAKPNGRLAWIRSGSSIHRQLDIILKA